MRRLILLSVFFIQLPLQAHSLDGLLVQGVVQDTTPALNGVSKSKELVPAFVDCDHAKAKGTSVQVAEGGESSTGNAHPYRDPGRACFTGQNRTIQACIVFPEDSIAQSQALAFGMSREDVRNEALAAFKSWADYIKEHRLNEWKDSPQLAIDVSVRSQCDGHEDLKIYFGGMNDEIKRAQDRNQYKEAWGLMSCNPPNSDGSWNKGLIWIAPPEKIWPQAKDWSERSKLRALFLREIGRMVGNGDVDGTIMRSDLSRWLAWRNPPAEIERLLTQIDWERVLDSQYTTKQDLKSQIDPKHASEFAGAFERLLERKPIGQMSQSLLLEEGYSYETRGRLILSDQKGSKTFALTARNIFSQCATVGERIFTRGGEQGSEAYSHSYSCIQFGEITDEVGRKTPIAIAKDTDRFRYHIVLPDVTDPRGNDLFRYTTRLEGYDEW